MNEHRNGVVTVLLVDDHAVVREGYRRLLERRGDITVVSEAANAADAYRLFCDFAPRVTVMDVALPGVSGIEAMRRILAHQPDARILVFSMYEDAMFARRALQAGARGYVTKASAPDVLVEAVHAVAAGERYLGAQIARELAMRCVVAERATPDALSGREFEVLRLLVQGLSIKAIAANVGLNPKTVANHQSSIKQKLGADSALQLFQIARKLGLDVQAP